MNKIVYTRKDMFIDAICGNPPPTPSVYKTLPNGDTVRVELEPKFEVIDGELCVVYDV